jgi:RND family efflux transporter MFP subunit
MSMPYSTVRYLSKFLGLLLLSGALSLLSGACGGDSRNGSKAGQSDSAAVKSTNDETNGQGEEESSGEDTSKKQRERTTSVDASKAFESDLVVPIIAEGTIRARHTTEIRSELAGRLMRLYPEEGQRVRRGQLIAKLDSREYEVAAEEARATYLNALSRLAVEGDTIEALGTPPQLQAKLDQLADLEKQGKITREEHLAREISLEIDALKDGFYRVDIVASRSGISAARTALERARLNLERTEIRAPFDGAVTNLILTAGEQIAVNEAICTLINDTDIEAEVGVLEADLGALKVDAQAFLVSPALSETLQVKVDVISPQFDRTTRTCQVLLRFNSEGRSFRPGMFVRAIIAGHRYPHRLLVPKEAILTRDGRPLLFKIEDGRSKWLYVQLGVRNDYLVEIEQVLQGGTLAPGDLVIVSDHLTLSHDAKVKVKKVVPSSDPWGSIQKDN